MATQSVVTSGQGRHEARQAGRHGPALNPEPYFAWAGETPALLRRHEVKVLVEPQHREALADRQLAERLLDLRAVSGSPGGLRYCRSGALRAGRHLSAL